MRYTFELSYHHNDERTPVNFPIIAKNDTEAVAKAFLKAMEYTWEGNHPEGTEFEDLFPIKLSDLMPLMHKSHEKIFKVNEEYINPGEDWYIHVWNLYEDRRWNRGFGVGTAEPNSTSKYENVWITMLHRGRPTTKAELIDAIEALAYDLNKLSQPDLLSIYNKLVAVSKG